MFEDLKHKRVLITGSSSGIGAGMASAFGAHGSNVIVHYSGNQEGANATAQSVTEAGGTAAIVQGNLTDESQLEQSFQEAWDVWDGFDILINNAGIVHKAAILDTPGDQWDNALNINLKAPYLLSRLYAATLIETESTGCIIHNSSIHGSKSVEFFSAYAASKAALNSLTAVQALEWAPHGIRVNAIAPGVTPVERTDTLLEKTQDTWLPYIPLGRYGKTEDLANLTLFLASEASSWITGQVYVSDGGTLARMNMPKREKPHV